MHADNMTDEQKKIVDYDGNIIVTAVPGSGKTKTLIDKVVSLASDAKNERYNVVLTYTNRAANEISDRLDNYNLSKEYIWSGTIHSFCLLFIVKNNSRFIDKYCCGIEVMDDDDALHLCEKIGREIGITVNYYNQPNYSIKADGSLEENRPGFIEVVKKFYERIDSENLINFDKILYESYKFLMENKFACLNLAYSIDWIIVDEYQDTKDLQYQIISLLSRANNNLKLMFVGDPNQAIYTNLGGVCKYKNELDDLMNRSFEDKRLTGCFRSSQKIIDYYNNFACIKEAIISRTKEYDKALISYTQNIDLKVEFPNFVIDNIRKLRSLDIPFEEICVLIPRNDPIFQLSANIRNIAPDIPLDSPTITPLKKMDDNILNLIGRLLFTKITYQNIRKCERITQNVLMELKSRHNITYNEDIVDNIINYIITSELDEQDIGTVVLENKLKYILSNIIGLPVKYYEQLLLDLIDATKRKISRYKTHLEDTVLCFISCYKEKNGVVLSTCHSCKGEEYRAVIIGGVNEEYIPHKTQLCERDEAKKMLYVIFSRAKEYLILSSEKPWNYGRHYPTDELRILNYKYDNF